MFGSGGQAATQLAHQTQMTETGDKNGRQLQITFKCTSTSAVYTDEHSMLRLLTVLRPLNTPVTHQQRADDEGQEMT